MKNTLLLNKIKKSYRIFSKFFLILFIKIIYPLFRILGIKISPPYNKVSNLDYIYSPETRRLVFNMKKKESFNKILVDTSFNSSFLCELGKKYSTNKSSLNLKGHRSGFTGFYNLFFSRLKDKEINFAEIGIEKNGSIKMWREFFPLANIHAFEFDEEKIQEAKKDKLKNTFYHKIDVRNNLSIVESFKETNLKFDVIIDDSTHTFKDQINIVNNCKEYLKNNGILILEDIYRERKGYAELDYYNSLREIKHLFYEIVFIETRHINNYTAGWKNEKILFFVKNDKKI
uniref:Methyltransferase domain-containing protein n=1 Tax=uncultured marine microorganism HF4000_005K23 TaxID=455508 RepID=B3T0N8_9ZZZZ|nr:hypothetical protein ALOHA_HF4000005K23ctg1g34 [uncultured marine microorganism HF4000_005K23]